ncbi:MAG: methyl-accepting chemotaxis protein [Opitutales bacterium]
MKLRLRHKVTGLAVISALLPVLALLLLFRWQENRISAFVMDQFESKVKDDLNLSVGELYGVLQTAQQLIQKRVDDSLSVAHYVFYNAGNLSFGPETVTWDGINQDNQQHQTILLPQMKVGGQWLGQNANISIPSPIVDQVKQLVGCTCTIFQRINDAGDMLRVDTNIQTLSGRRAIGTFIPSSSPVVRTVLLGQTYRGPAYVVNAWYQSAYEPIRDDTGRIAGMLYVGVKQESDNTIRSIMQALRVGTHGYVWATYGKNTRNLPPFILYGGGPNPPASLDSIRAADGQPVFSTFVKEALATRPGEVTFQTATWRDPKDPDNPEFYDKDVSFTYYAPWDWVVGITAYDVDFGQVRQQLVYTFWRLRFEATCGALVLLACVALLATVLGRRLAAPITFISRIARQVADGNLAEAGFLVDEARGGRLCPIAARGTDETGELFTAIAAMIENLHSLLGRVQNSSRRLQESAANLAGAAREQETTVQDFGASTSQIAAAVKEISATAQELAHTMSGISSMATDTATAANAGRSQIEAVNALGHELARATGSISTRLTTIADKARNINSVITTITKVADQTNLLSLNAAIEAEKAGEFGLGFSVVAREIRRLADQTAEATLDIEQMVKEMQSAVSAGVMEMDKFSEAVRSGAARRGEVTGHLVNIIQQVEDFTPRLGEVKEGMQSQSQGAQQISEAVSSLNQGAQRTAASLDGFKSATRTLNDAVASLREGVAQFRLTADGSNPPADDSPPAPAPLESLGFLQPTD